MSAFKISIIGAGSSYTPEIIERLAQMQEALPVDEICLMDINSERLEIMSGFCRRYLDHLQTPIHLTHTRDRAEAIRGAKYIITQIRVGGNDQRILDEKIPLKYGIIGQETTGPGGMFKAFRTIPAMLEIARDVERLNPSAWIINYANPTGLNAEAVLKHTHAKFVGLCSGGLFPAQAVHRALDVPKSAVHYDYFGLNHLNFAYNFTVNGTPLSDEEFDRVAETANGRTVEPDLLRVLRLIPSPYLQYFYHQRKIVQKALNAPLTRGEQVKQLEHEVYAAYADPAQHTKPEALAKRGGGGYSEIALSVIDALENDRDRLVICNVANQGAIHHLPDDAVVEINCLVNASGIHPLHLQDIPAPVWGLIGSVKNYEQLAVEAAVNGSRETALLALMAHPLVGDYETAKDLLAEMLEANRRFLPQFFPDERNSG
ncbi:MAG: 6-phospho-beta-glucosidase [Anaerolineaceae bacterium]|nr:6-phospho-beta-glucosidase [Anaerolineaceae bacterium]